MQKSDSVTTIIKVKASAIYTNVYTLQIGPDEIGLFKWFSIIYHVYAVINHYCELLIYASICFHVLFVYTCSQAIFVS